jgi:hypothetical protein
VDGILTERTWLSLKGDAEPLGDAYWRSQRSALVEGAGERCVYL